STRIDYKRYLSILLFALVFSIPVSIWLSCFGPTPQSRRLGQIFVSCFIICDLRCLMPVNSSRQTARTFFGDARPSSRSMSPILRLVRSEQRKPSRPVSPFVQEKSLKKLQPCIAATLCLVYRTSGLRSNESVYARNTLRCSGASYLYWRTSANSRL